MSPSDKDRGNNLDAYLAEIKSAPKAGGPRLGEWHGTPVPDGSGPTPAARTPTLTPGGPTPAPFGRKTTGPRVLPLFRRKMSSADAKNLAYIAAGFCILAMGPVAEHLISNQGVDGALMESGFDRKGFSFADLGEAAMGAGSLDGATQESITALRARDPASLIVSGMEKPEAEQERPIRSMRTPSPRSSGWKDAISSAGRRGAVEAARSAGLPRPGARMAGKLNAMSSSSGGRGGGSSGSTLSANNLSAPSSRGLSHVAEPKSSLSRVDPTPDYRGAGQRGLASGANGFGFFQDGRRTTLTGAGLSNGGGWGPGGGTGGVSHSPEGARGHAGGRPMHDDQGKSPGASASNLESRNVSVEKKEDLAYERRKMEMQKAIDLKYEKKKYDQIERKKMREQIALQTASQAALKVLDKALDLIFNAQGGAEGKKKKKQDEAQQQQQGGGG